MLRIYGHGNVLCEIVNVVTKYDVTYFKNHIEKSPQRFRPRTGLVGGEDVGCPAVAVL